MNIKYTGTSDFQEFSKADFAKANVDQGKLRFAQNEPTEVSDEVGQALTSKEGIFGDFSFEEVNDDGEADSSAGGSNSADGADAQEDPEVNADTSGEGATPQQGVEQPAGARRGAAKKATSAGTP